MAPLRRFARFSLTGLVGAAVQLGLFELLLKGLRLPDAAAIALAVEITVLHNFLWHERFTWRDRQAGGLRRRAVRLWRFHVTNGLVSLGGNTLLIYCLVQVLSVPALPSAAAAIAVCAPANFLLSDRWVYR